MDGWLLFIPPGRLKSIQNERDVFCKKEDVSRINASVYFRRKMWLGSLQHVGLDVRGGLGRFSKLMDEHYDKGTLLPTTSIIVVDAEKASKYFDIGMQVSATPSYPQTLQEAAERYAQIAKLVEDANGTTPTVKELDKKIEEATDANVIWELKREKFRVQIKEKYKEMLLDMAVEERFEGEVSGPFLSRRMEILTELQLETIRERKRTRVGGG